jgi:hypothetical protein
MSPVLEGAYKRRGADGKWREGGINLHTIRHPDESQDPGLQAATFVALDPDFRQDDEVGGDGDWFARAEPS